MYNLVLFGPPGSGKGTQSLNIAQKYKLVHLSTGDMLREEIAKASPLGIKVKEAIAAGHLVSDEIVISLISQHLDEYDEVNAGHIFDGFPRTIEQAEKLDALLAVFGAKISQVISLEVSEEELFKRLKHRALTSGRLDDGKDEVVRHRITEYENKTLPLKKYYQAQGKLIEISGIGEISEITLRISVCIEKYLNG